jgi:hypothetical protein
VTNLDWTIRKFVTHLQIDISQKHTTSRFSEITYPLVYILVTKHDVLFDHHSDNLSNCVIFYPKLGLVVTQVFRNYPLLSNASVPCSVSIKSSSHFHLLPSIVSYQQCRVATLMSPTGEIMHKRVSLSVVL